jgi:hypothetical protein
MSKQQNPQSNIIVGISLFFSAVMMVVIGFAIFGKNTFVRNILIAVAFIDVLLGLFFLRKGQSGS